MLEIALLVIGFVFLIKGASVLVEGATAIASRLHVSQMAIGLTIVAFGTSLPELFVNLFAAIYRVPDISVGNILGSNIANILLILGISAIITPLRVEKGTVWEELPWSLVVVVVLFVLVSDPLLGKTQGALLSTQDGLVLIVIFVMFLYHTILNARAIDGLESVIPTTTARLHRAILMIIGGLLGLTIGGRWIVNGASYLARLFGLSEEIIGLTIVALGTSLPELVTSIVAASKGNIDIAIGNVVGSNIFNILFIFGVGALIDPIPFGGRSSFDLWIVLAASILLFGSMFTGKRRVVDRWEGLVFVVLYFGYILFLFLCG